MKSSRVSVVVVNDSTAAAVAAPSGRWCSQFTEELQFDIFLKRILLSSAVKIVKSAKEELLRLLLRRVCVLWQKTTTTTKEKKIASCGCCWPQMDIYLFCGGTWANSWDNEGSYGGGWVVLMADDS